VQQKGLTFKITIIAVTLIVTLPANSEREEGFLQFCLGLVQQSEME
jgi:hypothetical protein